MGTVDGIVGQNTATLEQIRPSLVEASHISLTLLAIDFTILHCVVD